MYHYSVVCMYVSYAVRVISSVHNRLCEYQSPSLPLSLSSVFTHTMRLSTPSLTCTDLAYRHLTALCVCSCLCLRLPSYLTFPSLIHVLVPTCLRRSGLQDRLTVAELRRLSEKLRRRRPGSDKKKDKDRLGGCIVDYEKLCVLLTGVPDSIPISRSEAVFSRLRDCVEDSVTEGRPFLSLCALVDRQQTGSITKEVSRKTHTNNHKHTHTHIYIYLYIYIYMHIIIIILIFLYFNESFKINVGAYTHSEDDGKHPVPSRYKGPTRNRPQGFFNRQ